jgi:hypothetical protein
VVTESDTVEGPTVYTCQVATLRDGASDHLALICQIAEIHGTVEGDIDFFGQSLTIETDAVVKGDIRVRNGARI